MQRTQTQLSSTQRVATPTRTKRKSTTSNQTGPLTLLSSLGHRAVFGAGAWGGGGGGLMEGFELVQDHD